MNCFMQPSLVSVQYLQPLPHVVANRLREQRFAYILEQFSRLCAHEKLLHRQS
jgi:hypothetical protein